jgi:hypothetical protein
MSAGRDHEEIPVKVTAWIDRGVAPVVEALNAFGHVLTVDSCECDERQAASVLFRVRGNADDATGFASRLASTLNGRSSDVSYLLQAEWRPGEDEPLLALSCPPDQVPLLANLISFAHTRASVDGT